MERSRVIPEIVRLNPVIEEKFSLDVAEGKKNTCTKMFAGIGSGENFLVNTGLVISSINFVFYRKENLEQLGQMVTL